MSSVNKVIIIGNLGADPDVRYTQSNTAVANMSVATSERYKDRSGEWKEVTEWHKIVAWDRLAEIAQEYLSKGSKIYVEGSIRTNSWEDKDGQKRYTTEIRAQRMRMLDSRSDRSGNQNAQPAQKGQNDQKLSSDVSLNDQELDEDLPF